MLIKTKFNLIEKPEVIRAASPDSEITDVVPDGNELTVECTIISGANPGLALHPTFHRDREARRFGRLLSAIKEALSAELDTSRLYDRKLTVIVGEEEKQRRLRKKYHHPVSTVCLRTTP